MYSIAEELKTEGINSFREEDEYSIFITGSNSYLLSGELVTKLTGRYLEFEMFPLTDRGICSWVKKEELIYQ